MKLLTLFAAFSVLAAQTPPPQTPVFKSGATLVPLDVRVLDRGGKPITDLKQSEFVVTEDGRSQEVSHFSATALAPMAAADTPGLLRGAVSSGTLAPQTRRVFLLLLGRGRLQPPSKGVDAMMQFVRERVLPQDQVAVLAWNRATDFTTNHAGLEGLLGRFKARHEKIETDLSGWFSGLRAIYGDKTIPAPIQKQIDDVFAAPGLRTAHTLVSDPNERTATTDELKARGEALQRAETLRNRPPGTFLTDAVDPVTSKGIEGSFEQFMAQMMTTNQDLSNLYAAIEYLRFIEGEKHVVFVTEHGIALPDFSQNMALAAVANNARVVIDTIQTGGAPADGLPSAANRSGGMPAPLFGPMFAVRSLRDLSQETGGVASVFSYADKAVKRIDEATRFGYLLGYYATNSVQDGKYRRVSVKVTRPGAEVLYRHGYYARSQALPPDRRDMMSYTRMTSAFTTSLNVYDIPLGFNAREEKDGDKLALALNLTVGLAKMAPAMVAGKRYYTMELAVVCADREQNIVGQYSQRLEFSLTEEQYQKALKEGTPANVSVRVPLTNFATHVKVVVYNFANDLLGSIVKKVR